MNTIILKMPETGIFKIGAWLDSQNYFKGKKSLALLWAFYALLSILMQLYFFYAIEISLRKTINYDYSTWINDDDKTKVEAAKTQFCSGFNLDTVLLLVILSFVICRSLYFLVNIYALKSNKISWGIKVLLVI